MADFDLQVDGLQLIEEELKKLEDDVDNPITWYAGTNVFYSVYLEFGTSKMDPRTFMRPALNEARSGVDAFIRRHTNTDPETIDDVNEYIQTLAFAFESRIKGIITQKNIIDTGRLRASILAVPVDPSQLPSVEDFDNRQTTFDPDEGRQVVDIEVDV
jgi:hypothetical protein